MATQRTAWSPWCEPSEVVRPTFEVVRPIARIICIGCCFGALLGCSLAPSLLAAFSQAAAISIPLSRSPSAECLPLLFRSRLVRARPSRAHHCGAPHPIPTLSGALLLLANLLAANAPEPSQASRSRRAPIRHRSCVAGVLRRGCFRYASPDYVRPV